MYFDPHTAHLVFCVVFVGQLLKPSEILDPGDCLTLSKLLLFGISEIVLICTIGHQITIKHNFIDVDTVGKVPIARCPAETEGLPILQLYHDSTQNIAFNKVPILQLYHASTQNIAFNKVPILKSYHAST